MPNATTKRKYQDAAARAQHTNSNSQLRLFLMIVIGVCLLISAYVNISHSHPSMIPDSSVYQAMEDFKKGFANYGYKALSELNENLHIQEPAMDNHVDTVSDAVDHGDDSENNINVKELGGDSEIAKLSCAKHGGPPDEFAQEMVYWSDIPSDSKYVSPLKVQTAGQKRYMTFEPDGGGWNNIRMAMETVVGLAAATGRTLGTCQCTINCNKNELILLYRYISSTIIIYFG